MRIASAVPTALLISAISFLPAAATEPEAGLEEICKVTKCRPPGTFKLRTEDGEKELKQSGLPYLYKEQVLVLPGDEFDIEISFADDGKAAVLALPGDHPGRGKTFHIRFSQMDEGVGMMLSLRNETDATIKYDAFVVPPDGRSGKTSSCPVMSGLGAFEIWPHPIRQLILMNFRKLDKSDNMTCS